MTEFTINLEHLQFVEELHPRGRVAWARQKQLHGLFATFDKAVTEWRIASGDYARRLIHAPDQRPTRGCWVVSDRYYSAGKALGEITERIYAIAEQDHVAVITAKLEAMPS